MDKVARMSPADRAALFNEAGAARGLANTIIEKDFWACWTLKRLFGIQGKGAANFVFKGGTSLSKCYGAIRRFSEDLDLSFDRKELGYAGNRDPTNASNRKAKALIESLMTDVQNHIATTLLPLLNSAIADELGSPNAGKWALVIEPGEAQNLIFRYPPSLASADYANFSYLTRHVKLEFGARGDPWPTERRNIQPYASEEFPDFFESPSCIVDALALRRTFWEKATLLHAEYHRSADSPTPRYISRHYYDLAMLADRDDGKTARRDTDLLLHVADHKSVYFRSAWAHYSTARPGTLRLVPVSGRLSDLRKDYREMAPMIFDSPAPSFDDIMKRIKALEESINGA